MAATRWRVTIRGEGTELRGYAAPDALRELANVEHTYVVIASPAEPDYNPFKEVTDE